MVPYDETRVGRRIEVSTMIRNALRAAGVIIHYSATGEVYEPDSETGVIMSAVTDAMSKAEVMKLVRRAKDGKRRSVRDGSAALRLQTSQIGRQDHAPACDIRGRNSERDIPAMEHG